VGFYYSEQYRLLNHPSVDAVSIVTDFPEFDERQQFNLFFTALSPVKWHKVNCDRAWTFNVETATPVTTIR